MQHELDKVEAARYYCEQLIAEALHERLPLECAFACCGMHLDNEQLPQPEDLLAFVTNGRLSDSQVS